MSLARKYTHFSRNEITDLFAHATRIEINAFWDVLIAPKQRSHARILIVVSRTLGTAPERNLIKRRIKHLFLELGWHELPCDIVLIVKRPAMKLSFDQMRKKLSSVLSLINEHTKVSK